MARYDNNGYRADGRRQILGYSRAVQGGADAARERAARRVYDAQDHLYAPEGSLSAAVGRARRVANAKASGEFEDIRNTYNEEAAGAGREMDQAGNIGKRVTYRTPTAYTPKKPVARATPMTYMRPVDQRINDTVAMTSGSGLLDMARRARRRGTLVVQ